MSGTSEENTRWVEVWLVNDGEYYDFARDVARREGASGLARYVHRVLKAAKRDTGAWHTAREMSEADYDRVDWQELVETLLSE